MVFTTSRKFSFEASHAHSSHRQMVGHLHGHSWRVQVTLYANTLDAHGTIIDEAEFERFQSYLNVYFHEKHLNDVLDQPTPEVLAQKLHGVLKERWPGYVIIVGISDTQRSWATYTEEKKSA